MARTVYYLKGMML